MLSDTDESPAGTEREEVARYVTLTPGQQAGHRHLPSERSSLSSRTHGVLKNHPGGTLPPVSIPPPEALHSN